MAAYSMDLRIRAVGAIDAGKPASQVANELQVSERWVFKLLKQRRDGLGLKPLYAGRCGRPRKFSKDDEQRLIQDVRAFPDSTAAERVERLKLSVKALQAWRWLIRLGITHKKRRWLPASVNART